MRKRTISFCTATVVDTVADVIGYLRELTENYIQYEGKIVFGKG